MTNKFSRLTFCSIIFLGACKSSAPTTAVQATKVDVNNAMTKYAEDLGVDKAKVEEIAKQANEANKQLNDAMQAINN